MIRGKNFPLSHCHFFSQRNCQCLCGIPLLAVKQFSLKELNRVNRSRFAAPMGEREQLQFYFFSTFLIFFYFLHANNKQLTSIMPHKEKMRTQRKRWKRRKIIENLSLRLLKTLIKFYSRKSQLAMVTSIFEDVKTLKSPQKRQVNSKGGYELSRRKKKIVSFSCQLQKIMA